MEIVGRDDLPALAIVDGRLIEADEWAVVVPVESMFLRRLPAGNDSVRIIGTIAILAFAAWAGPVAAAALFQGSMVSAGFLAATGAVFTAGIGIAGTLLLNHLVPPPAPPSVGRDPTALAFLTSQSNQVGSFAPIPVLYGTIQYYPPVPMTALPYTEIVGNDQYFRSLFVLGYGPLQLAGISTADGLITDSASPGVGSAIKIGGTPITEFEDVNYEIGSPDEVNLYTGTVVESQVNVQIPMTAEASAGVWVAEGDTYTQTTAADTDEISIDLYIPALFSVNGDNGKIRGAAVRFKVEARLVSTSPIGAWVTLLNTWEISSSSRDPIRVGKRFELAATGQYDVRLTRVSTNVDKTDGDSWYADAVWSTLRSIKRDNRAFTVPGTVVMAIRIRASDQLGGRLDRLSVTATRILPVWDTTVSPNAWVDTPTRSPAWAYVDVLTGSATRNALSKSRIDLDAITAWAAWCATEGLYCDLVIDATGTVFDRARDIASAGLGTWHISDEGSISIVRDVVATSKMLVSPRNIAEFAHEYTYPDIPHCLRVQFVDPDRWEATERLVYADGYNPADSPHTTPTKFQQLQLLGVTDADQAWKLGRYHMAALQLRPEQYSWKQDIGQMVFSRGDSVDLHHDVILVGLRAGRIKSIALDELTAEVDELLPMDSTSPQTVYALKIQLQDGSVITRTISTVPPGTTSVTFGSAATGVQAGDHFIFGVSGAETIKAKVIRIEPQGNFQARIVAAPAADDIYDAWTGSIPTFDPIITAPVEIERQPLDIPIILALIADETVAVQDSGGELRIRMAVTFYVEASQTAGASIDVQVRDATSDESTSPATTLRSPWRLAQTVRASAGVAYVDGIEQLVTYEVRIRARREERVSLWTAVESLTVADFAVPTIGQSLRIAQESSADAQYQILAAATIEPIVRPVPMPLDMSLWLRSEDATETAGTLTAWPDHSNAGATVSIGAAPAVTANVINGFQTVTFAGAEYMTVDGLSSVFNGDNLPFSLFVLCKVSSLAADRTVFSAGRAASITPYMSARARTSVNTWSISRRGDDNVFTQRSATTDSIDTSTWSLLAVVFDGAFLTAYINGRRIFEDGDVTAGSMTIDQVTVGANRRNSITEYFQGEVAEILLYDYAVSAERRHCIEQYLGDRYDLDISHSYYVSTSGSDSNAGMSAASPLATVAEAYGRLGDIGGTIRLEAPASNPFRTAFNLNVARRIVLDATDRREPWHWYGTTKYTAGWTSAGGSVWYQTIATGSPSLDTNPTAPIFITTLTDGDFYASLFPVGDTTTPGQGEYGFNVATGRVYVRMPADEDPNDHDLEVSTELAPIRVSNNRSAPLIVRNGVIRGGRTGGLVATSTGSGGLIVAEDCTVQFANNNVAIQPAGGFAGMLCRRVVSQKAMNDGFNLHNDALLPCYMRLEDCEASYNGDEGASPHDSTVMDIIGGTYQFNGSAGVTAIQNALLRIFGATFSDNSQTIGPSLTEGGIYFSDRASGYAVSAIVQDNDGPGIYVVTIGLVDVLAITSTGNTYSDTY